MTPIQASAAAALLSRSRAIREAKPLLPKSLFGNGLLYASGRYEVYATPTQMPDGERVLLFMTSYAGCDGGQVQHDLNACPITDEQMYRYAIDAVKQHADWQNAQLFVGEGKTDSTKRLSRAPRLRADSPYVLPAAKPLLFVLLGQKAVKDWSELRGGAFPNGMEAVSDMVPVTRGDLLSMAERGLYAGIQVMLPDCVCDAPRFFSVQDIAQWNGLSVANTGIGGRGR